MRLKNYLRCLLYGHQKAMAYATDAEPFQRLLRVECWYCNRVVWRNKGLLGVKRKTD